MNKPLRLILSFVICLGAGALGSAFTISSIPPWYASLNKPSFSPPNYVFAPVWTILYALMGISLYIVWSKGIKTRKVRDAVYFFGIQLILNALWSPVFFGARNILLALVIIIILWIYILKTIFAFAKVEKKASYLLVPYFLWVSFATILNFSIWLLNK